MDGTRITSCFYLLFLMFPTPAHQALHYSLILTVAISSPYDLLNTYFSTTLQSTAASLRGKNTKDPPHNLIFTETVLTPPSFKNPVPNCLYPSLFLSKPSVHLLSTRYIVQETSVQLVLCEKHILILEPYPTFWKRGFYLFLLPSLISLLEYYKCII